MAAPLFFVPLAIAGGKVFFKFAGKAAAEAFKKRIPAAGKVTKTAPAQRSTVVTTNTNKGKAILKDLEKPVTKPTISPRNPNTKALPKPPKSNGGGKAAGATAAVVGGTASATKTGDSSKSGVTKEEAKRKIARAEAREKRLQADSARAKKKKTAPSRTEMGSAAGKAPAKKAAKKTVARTEMGKAAGKAPKRTAEPKGYRSMDSARPKTKPNTRTAKKTMTSDKARRQARR